MNKPKVLNLYSGLGGNRKLWGDRYHVTAIEYDTEIARIYYDLYPNDLIIVTDAHQYLLDHYKDFDFIWSSPPCQSHSSFRQQICVRFRGTEPVYPDMKLYQELIFLKYNFKGKWIIENVRPYYAPLIDPDYILQRHYIWCNFEIEPKEFKKDNLRTAQIKDLQKKFGIDLSGYKIPNKRQLLRNCVEPKLGLHVLESADFWR